MPSQARKRRSKAASSSGRGKADAAPGVVPAGAKKHANNAWKAAFSAANAPQGQAGGAAGRRGKGAAPLGAQAGRAGVLALWVAGAVFVGWLLSGGWRSVALRLPPVRRRPARKAERETHLPPPGCAKLTRARLPPLPAAAEADRSAAEAAPHGDLCHRRRRHRRRRSEARPPGPRHVSPRLPPLPAR